MHDLRPAAREMTRLVDAVRDDQLGDPTPCTRGDASLLPTDWRGEIAAWLDRLVETWSNPAAWDGTAWIAGFEAPAYLEFVAMMSGPGSEEARGYAFGPALPVPVGASALDEVIAGNGRDPAWSAGGLAT